MRRLVLVSAIASLAVPAAAAGRVHVPRFADCGRASVKPPTVVVACADAGFSFTRLAWSTWRASEARAEGTAWRNLCVPDCAAGHFTHWRVAVRLYRPHFCRRYDRVLFTRVAWRSIGAVPARHRKSDIAGTIAVPLVHACP